MSEHTARPDDFDTQVIPAYREPAGTPTNRRLTVAAAITVLVVLASIAYLLFAGGGAQPTAGAGRPSTSAPSEPPDPTATESSSHPARHVPPPGQSGSAGSDSGSHSGSRNGSGSESHRPAPAPLTASIVNPPSVDTATYSGPCSATHRFTVSATVRLNRAGSITYRWLRSDGSVSRNETLAFLATTGGTSRISTDWTLSAIGSHWISLQIVAPNALRTPPATFAMNCTPSLTVGNLVMSSASQTTSCSRPVPFAGQVELSVDQGSVSVTYRYVYSDGFRSLDTTVTVSAGSPRVISGAWNPSTSGTRWMAVEIVAPIATLTNRGYFTLTCV